MAICFVGGNAAGLNEATDATRRSASRDGPSVIVADGDFDDPAVENVLITARSGALDRAAAEAAADRRGGPAAAGHRRGLGGRAGAVPRRWRAAGAGHHDR